MSGHSPLTWLLLKDLSFFGGLSQGPLGDFRFMFLRLLVAGYPS